MSYYFWLGREAEEIMAVEDDGFITLYPKL